MGRNWQDGSRLGTDKDRWNLQETLRKQHLTSLNLDSDLSKDFAVPGYQGHIPRHRQTLGKSFGLTSQEAINNFHEEQKTSRLSFQDHYVINNGSLVQDTKPQWKSNPGPLGKIYPTESGLIPRYSGYIPGQKFRFGGTSTRLSVNSTKQIK